MARVVLKNVTKRFPGVEAPAVDNVSLEARDGEFLVLVGPSGCGKSTTLRLVAGLEEATSGDIIIGERKVNDVPPKDRDIAMIFQNYALYPHMTVYQNMGFGLKMRKFPKAEIDASVRKAADILGISDLLDRKPKALSGGQRQRVAVGRAIVREPEVFLFDEPLSNLDANMRVTMRNEICKLHRQLKTTMIYVTHDQVEAMTMGDRIVVMDQGRVQQIDEPDALYRRPCNKFVAQFIGSPSMNFIAGRLSTGDGALFFDEGTFRLALPADCADRLRGREGQDVILGLRPEDFSERPATEEGGSPDQAVQPVQITAQVENREPLGAELILYLSAGASSIRVRLGSDATGEIGKPKTLFLNMAKAHFFDASTEERIQ